MNIARANKYVHAWKILIVSGIEAGARNMAKKHQVSNIAVVRRRVKCTLEKRVFYIRDCV